MYNIVVNEVIRSFVDIKPTEIILPNFPVIVGVKRDEKSDFFCLFGERRDEDSLMVLPWESVNDLGIMS